jgi:microcystin degradation protein MlrC
MTRVLLAGLFHETHCFTDDINGIGRFRACRGAEITTRGPCTSDPRLLPYTRLRRPVFPLDALD